MPCAIKVIRKSKLNKSKIFQQLNKNEFEILEETNHPHITRVFELMEDSKNFYIVMELMTGGNLIEKLRANQMHFTEVQVASVVNQMLLALNFMHSKNIMHRDIKPENIMCEDCEDLPNEKIYIKLTDFGFAVKYDPNKKEQLSVGTPLYMAPELCERKPYDNKVDVWAVGVIAYYLLVGQTPFMNRHQRRPDKIQEGIFHDIKTR